MGVAPVECVPVHVPHSEQLTVVYAEDLLHVCSQHVEPAPAWTLLHTLPASHESVGYPHDVAHLGTGLIAGYRNPLNYGLEG